MTLCQLPFPSIRLDFDPTISGLSQETHQQTIALDVLSNMYQKLILRVISEGVSDGTSTKTQKKQKSAFLAFLTLLFCLFTYLFVSNTILKFPIKFSVSHRNPVFSNCIIFHTSKPEISLLETVVWYETLPPSQTF